MDFTDAIKKAERKILNTAATIPNGTSFPSVGLSADGEVIWQNGGCWTEGFWPGQLYLAYQDTENEAYLKAARTYEDFFDVRAENDPDVCEKNGYIPLDHDIGFIFSLSRVADYKLTGNERAKNFAIKAARVLKGRFNEKGKFIRAWDTWKWDTDEEFIRDKKGKAIIDSMMNMPILFWAAKETGEQVFYDVAYAHATTVMKNFVRADGSIYHTFNFNPETGEPIQGKTGQGYHDESAWSRGQSWGVHGFALAYMYTKDEVFLKTAEKVADYFIDHLSKTYLPKWDFCVEEAPYIPIDASAAACAASGMLEIYKYTKKEKYKECAEKMLFALTTICSTLDNDNFQPLLLHTCVGPAYAKGTENVVGGHTDTPSAYADFFYLEAMLKLKNPNMELFW